LRNLPAFAEIEGMEIIVGDSTCNECEQQAKVLLYVGTEFGYDEGWVRLCKQCIEKAAQIEWPE
jgi:hypothetical protein